MAARLTTPFGNPIRLLNPISAAYLAVRTGVASRYLVHLIAHNCGTGAQETLGLWQGDDHPTIANAGTKCTYYSAGGLIRVEPIRMFRG